MNQGLDTGDPYQVGVTFRVEFADTDTQARVYYGNYFRYFDRARFAYWEAIGCDGAGVRRCEEETVLVDVGAAYKAPVRFWEQVTVRCRMTRLGRSSLHTVYQMTAGPEGRLIAEGHETLVWFDPRSNRAVPVPEDIRRRIEAFEGPRLAGC
jgi:acyl-CoA thioester hydrolase